MANIDDITIIWDMAVQTDRTILANRPDLLLHHRVEKQCLLIDSEILDDDNNIMFKDAEKLRKYKDLEIVVIG